LVTTNAWRLNFIHTQNGPPQQSQHEHPREFAERVGEVKVPRGSKTERVLAALNRFAGEFTVSQLEQACPGVSRDMIRRVLREQQSANAIECQGREPAARWKKKG
jgi:hypothetical protein